MLDEVDQYRERSAPGKRVLARLAAVALFGLAAVFVLGGLAQPSAASARPAAPVQPSLGAEAVYPSNAMTYQVYLPVVLHGHPISSTFGLQFYGSLSSARGFSHAVASRAGWVRFAVDWHLIEPANTTPDNYNWAGLDASVRAVQASSMRAIFTIEGNPTWAASKPGGPVTNTADLREFVGAVVARYPSIRYWEIYNEPDSKQRFGTQGAAYAATLSGLYPIIKAANPAAQVVFGGLALDWFIDQGGPFDRYFLANVLANCHGTCFDVANFHYYPAFRGNWEPYGRDIIGKANFVRQTLATYHLSRPIFATETGWPAGSTWGSPELAARYVPKTFARSLAAGLSATVWFAMLDADLSYPGLLDSTTIPGSLIPRPAYYAFQTLAKLMTDVKYLGVAPVSDPLEGYQLSVPGKRIDVYWYDCPQVKAPTSDGPRDCTDTAALSVLAVRVAVIDKLGGQSIRLDGDDGVADGRVTLNVGSSPIYIDYNP